MFIRLLRSTLSYQLIILFILGLLLWMPSFLAPPPLPSSYSVSPVFELIIAPIRHLPILLSVLGLLLVYTEAVVLNQILAKNGLSGKNSAMPALLFVLLVSFQPDALILSPAIIAMAFLIFFLHAFLNVYEQTDPFKEVFSAAFSISLASLFHFHLFSLILVMWIGFFIFRVFSWREWVISLAGLALPYLIAAAIFFWNDTLATHWQLLKTLFPEPRFEVRFSSLFSAAWIVLIFFLLASILRVLLSLQEKLISIRKNFLFVTWFFLLSVPMLFFAGDHLLTLTIIPLLPGSALLANHFSSIKRFFWWELLFSVFLILIVILRFV